MPSFRKILLILAVTIGVIGGMTTKSFAEVLSCTKTTTPASVNSDISSAKAGDVICLGSGTYSGITLSNNARSGYATVQSAPGTNVNIGGLNLNNVSYLHFQNLTFSGGTLTGSHLQLTDSTGVARLVGNVSQILKITGTIANADILIDRITYNNIPNPCLTNDCIEGRISIMDGKNPAGITISNSLFSGGNSDGIQLLGDPVGVQIIGNEFTQLNASQGTHTDSIQTYYGGSGTVIKNNYFHDTEDGIMAPDGGTNEQIIGNVFDIKGYPFNMNIWGWSGGLIQHNVFKYGTTCDWNSCGTLWVNTSSGLVAKDNIIGELKVDSGALTEDYNLINVGGTVHGHTIKGTATFIGGTNPTTYEGFALAAGSKGKGAASDGTDMGINVDSSGGGNTTATYHSIDLTNLLAHYGITSGMTTSTGDINGDSAVNIYDLSTMLSDYSAT